MKHFINDILIAPENLQDIGIKSNFTGNPNELEISVTSITLPREGYDLVKQHIDSIGYFEGIPYKVSIGQDVNIESYIDLTDGAKYRDYTCEVNVKKRKGKDDFFDKAKGLSFENVVKNGFSFASFNVPYVIVKDNQAELGITLAISLYIMTKELIDAIKQLVVATTQLIQASTPNLGVPPSFNTGAIISAVLLVVAQIIYIATLLVAIIKLGQQLLELIFPKVRYLLGTKVKNLIQVACQSIGYEFKSTLLDGISGLTIVPKPLKKQSKGVFDFLQNELNQSFNKGYPTAQDTTPILMDLMEAIADQFNGQIRLINGVVYLERRDYWQNITTNILEPALNLQDSRQDEYTINTDEAWKRYYIHYQTDISDLHTFNDFEGTDAEYSTEPANIVNADLVTIKGLNEVNIPFALGKRKEKLNWIEKTAKALFEVIDSVATAFGGNSSLSATIDNRIGVMQISQQYFNATKMLYTTTGGKQPSNYLDFIRASKLWDNYHYINQIQLNGYKIRTDVPIRLRANEFVNLLGNNFAEFNGVIIELLDVTFFDEKHEATISYKEPLNYAVGKVKTITINS